MTRRRASWIATLGFAGSAAALVLVGAVPLMADVSVKPTASVVQARSIGDALAMDGDAAPDLRALPLGLSDEQRQHLVPADSPTDTSAVRDAIRDSAAKLGLEDVIDDAIATEVPPDAPRTYPYAIPGVDELIRPNLDRAAAEADPKSVVELSGLLTVLAGAEERVFGGDVEMPAGVAYSLLDASREIAPTCDVQINLTFLVTLGMLPEFDNVMSEVSRAKELCADDPMPLWIEGQYLRKVIYDSGFKAPLPKKRSELRGDVREVSAELRNDFPGSPLGWVGDADLLMAWAASSAAEGAEPFQVRSWRLEALDLYRVARTKSPDPRLAAGEARALSTLDRHDDAVSLAQQAEAAAPDELSILIVLADTLAAAGRHAEAADAYSAETNAVPVWNYLAPTNLFTTGFTGEFGWREFPDLTVYDLTTGGYGGADVKDTGFIPATRYIRDNAFCPVAQQQAQLVLADRAAELSERVEESAPWSSECALNSYYQSLADRYRSIAAVAGPQDSRAEALGNLPAAEYWTPDEVELQAWDTWQDLMRSGNKLERAEKVAEQWSKAQPDAGLAHQRLGEIRLLRDDPKSAIAPLERAVKLLTEQADNSDGGYSPESLSDANWRDLATLQHSYARAETGDASAARKGYQTVVDAYTGGGNFWDDKLVMFAHSQIGELDFERQRWKPAARSFDQAIAVGSGHEEKVRFGLNEEFEVGQAGMLRGAQENNLALAEAKQGRTKQAVAAARAALTRDAQNPVYLDTLAFVQHLGGDDAAAAAAYQKAIGADTSSFVSSNNLAVILADGGDTNAAKKLLRSSLAANPDYASAWHNLGVLEARSWKPSALLSSQAALAKAARLDPNQRDAGRGLQVDDEVYDSGLDVGQALKADWSYASSASSPVRPITLTMILLLFLRVVRIIGLDRFGAVVAGRVVASNPSDTNTVSWFWRRLRVRWGVALSAVALAWGALFARPDASTLVYVLAIAALVTLPLLARMFIASRRREPVRHFTWTPAVAVAAVGTPLGLGFTPFPSIDERSAPVSRAVRWSSPAIVCVVAGAFLVLTLMTSSPLTRDVSAAALLMGASVLTPVPPMDGASLNNRIANIAITAALTVATLAYALHWV